MYKSLPKTEDIDILINEVQSLLNDKIFLGTYTEKRYVEHLQVYRDIIVVDNEDDIKNFLLTKEKIRTFNLNHWVGITENIQDPLNNKCLLWVMLSGVPIGKHWFQVSAIRFEAKEIILEIKHVQRYQSPNKTLGNDDPNFPDFSFSEIFTYQNVRESIKFTSILSMTIITFFIEALKLLGEYSIKLSHILVTLVQVSTPILLGIIDFLTKCVGGFYWLIYVLIRQPPNAPIPSALMTSQQRPYSSSENRASVPAIMPSEEQPYSNSEISKKESFFNDNRTPKNSNYKPFYFKRRYN